MCYSFIKKKRFSKHIPLKDFYTYICSNMYSLFSFLFIQGFHGIAGEPGMDGPTGHPVSFLLS